MNASTLPDVGSAAPGFCSATASGEEFDLAGQRGRYVVIWFFPRANTPG